MERYWAGRAGRLALRVNLGWWLHRFLPGCLAISVAGAALLLMGRRNGWSPSPVALGIALLLIIAGLTAWRRARSRFFSRMDALARLDLELGLFNRLTSAAEGVGSWPPPQPASDRIRWRASSVLPPLLGSPALIAGALFMPISAVRTELDRGRSEPLAWTEIEEIVEELSGPERVVDPASLEAWRDRLQELRDQPEDRWFEHASLEAGDHLREGLGGELARFEQDLEQAQRVLEQMRTAGTAGSKALDRAWKQALQDLELGELGIDPELLSELAEVDPNDARELTPEELERLKEALEKGLTKVRLAKGEKGEQDLVILVQGRRPGQGAIDRGRADAPLALRPHPTGASTGEAHDLATEDLTHAALGDVVGLSSREHEIDETAYRGPTSSGGFSGESKGGESVWKSSLPPAEQEFLERYFR